MTVVLVCDFNYVKMTVLAHCQGRPFCIYIYIDINICTLKIGIQPVWITPYIFHGSDAVTWEFLGIISHSTHHLSRVKMNENEDSDEGFRSLTVHLRGAQIVTKNG